MMAIPRHPCAPPPSISTPWTVTVWISRLVPKANMKRMEPICTRSALFLVTRAVNAE